MKHDVRRLKLAGYAVAAGCVLEALVMRWKLAPNLDARAPLLLLLLGVIVAAWYGGTGAGLATLVAGLFLGDYFFLLPAHSPQNPGVVEWLYLVAFSVIAGACVTIIGTLRRAQQRAERSDQVAASRGAQLLRDRLELDQVEARLRELAAVVQSAQDAIVSLTLEGNIRSWNAGAERIFGYSAEELLGRSLARLVPADRLAEHHAAFERLQRGERVETFETVRLTKAGLPLAVSVSLSPLRDGSGRVMGASAIMRDISELKSAQEKILRLNSELEERVHQRTAALEAANRELEAFSYSVSHDLRAPLRSITGFTEALLQDEAAHLDEKGLSYLRFVRDAGIRMGRLIEDLMDLSRASRATLEVREVDLSALAGSVAHELAQQEPHRAIEISILPRLVSRGDEGLLRIALENLLGNAWKFTARQPHPKIEVGALQDNGSRVYYVRDNGAGFDMAHADRLFGVFQRLHAQEDFPGTGIGLATVQRILHRHNGRVWAEARVNEGATFYFTLPNWAGSQKLKS